MYYMFESPLVWNIAAFVSFLYMPLVITIERKVFNKKLLWSYITYSIYSLTWVPITIQGCLNKNKKEWCHTQHTRQISIDEMEKIS